MKKSHVCIFRTLRYLHSFIFPVENGNHFHFLLINLYCYLVISKFRIIAFFRRVLQILTWKCHLLMERCPLDLFFIIEKL